jgi:prolyl-tRNA synthetase
MVETLKMLDVYADFAENFLAIPVIKGEKTEGERFPGAVSTYCIEAMMQDHKALQSGTSHFLGQNFAKSSNIKFQNRQGEVQYAFTTSWGVSTRLIGALIMTHSDDNGLVLPPKIAPSHAVIIPIYKTEEERAAIMAFVEEIKTALKTVRYNDIPIRLEIDDRDMTSSERGWYWIKKGIPLRLEIGPRDLQDRSVYMGRRDKEARDKQGLSFEDLISNLPAILDEMQENILQKALELRLSNTKQIDNKEEFYSYFTPKNAEQPEIHGGFADSHWCGNTDCETIIKDDLKVTVRCIPSDAKEEDGLCICCGKPSKRRVIFAKSY